MIRRSLARPASTRSPLLFLAGVFLGSPGLAAPQELAVEHVVGGLDAPIHASAPPGDSRIFICEQHTGQILVLRDGQLLETPFLDVGEELNGWLEGGLVHLVFHPDFESSGRFFVSLVDLGNELVVREYRVGPSPDVADPLPVQELFRLFQPSPIHNGGHMAFGPDGMLYLAVGDGGPGGDPSNRGQDTSNPFGAILRLDPDLPPPFVPGDNPLVGVEGAAEEIWIHGLRNPWVIEFDAQTGDLWIADVGQAQEEEIDLVPAGSPGGLNLGWRCREGTDCYQVQCCGEDGFHDPLFTYEGDRGLCAVIGGHVYRGARMPALRGAYLCGDYCSRELHLLRQEEGVLVSSELRPAPSYSGLPGFQKLHGIGVDGRGELLLVDGGNSAGSGDVFRLVPAPGVERYCAASLNSTGASALLGSLGTTGIGAGELALTVQGTPPGANGIFFYGPGPLDIPFADGRLCVAGGTTGLIRLPGVLSTDHNGAGTRPLDLASPPLLDEAWGVEPGETWFFQFWFRDTASTGAGENLSDALAITFAP